MRANSSSTARWESRFGETLLTPAGSMQPVPQSNQRKNDMALSIVKHAAPQVSQTRSAFIEHLRAIDDLNQTIATVSEKDVLAARRLQHADKAFAVVERLKAEIEQALAQAEIDGLPAPDVRQKDRDLAEAEQTYKQLAAESRGSKAVRTLCTEKTRQLQAERTELNRKTQSLLHATVVHDEMLAPELVAEFVAKEAAFRDVHRRVFMNAVAADKIAATEMIRPFVGSGLYNVLQITRPDHPAYPVSRIEALMPQAAELARYEDRQLLEREAGELIERLRNMEI
jgi:hypothetical protein